MLQRLHPQHLAALPAAVQRPAYDRSALQPGIVHLGLGNFARAFLLQQTEAALNAGEAPHWGVVGFSLQRPDMRDALGPQGGLYTLAERDGAGEQLRVVGCLLQAGFAPEAQPAVEEHVAAPATRIVSLTITEKGYGGGAATDALPTLLRGLALRRQRGLGGLTLLSLDNLHRNGRHLRERLLALAEGDAPLREWLQAECRIPCSMVDRIVPATLPADRERIAATLGLHDAWPVLAEPYLHWVLEDDFAAGRPAWRGVTWVHSEAEVLAWEAAKLRVVNGAHSALAYLGLAAGWATVHEAMAQPALHAYLQALLAQEVWPGLGLQAPPQNYGAQVLQRFTNPALAHRTAQIGMDGTLKLPLRLLPTVQAALSAGRPFPRTALALAAWVQYQRGHSDAGVPHAVSDPLAGPLAAHLAAAAQLPSAQARAAHWARFAPVFGTLAEAPAFVAELAAALQALEQLGAATALARYPSPLA